MPIDERSWIIGHKLKKLRIQKAYTLQKVAEKVGLTAPFLSMVEQGRSGISLTNLQKILLLYDNSSLFELLEKSNSDEKVIRLEQAKRLELDTEGVEALLITNNQEESDMFPVYFRLAPNTTINYMEHPGYEFLFVIEGLLEISLINPDTNEEEIYTLGNGDTISHASTIKHKCKNISNKTAIFLVNNTRPPKP